MLLYIFFTKNSLNQKFIFATMQVYGRNSIVKLAKVRSILTIDHSI